MIVYTLFNKRINKRLIHPHYGLWCAPTIEEAADMLRACKKCAEIYGPIAGDFVIIDVETGEEVDSGN